VRSFGDRVYFTRAYACAPWRGKLVRLQFLESGVAISGYTKATRHTLLRNMLSACRCIVADGLSTAAQQAAIAGFCG